MDFLKQKLQDCVERTNNILSSFIKLQSFHDTSLIEVMEYGSLLGGKRLRPFLVYTIGNMFGIDSRVLDAPAAAIECIHAYSLIHDDLPAMDNDKLRRGLPSCHIKYGEANAILAGNALQTMAFSILSDSSIIGISDKNRLAMISELAIASGVSGICGGQASDLKASGQQITLQKLESIYQYKTVALIRSAVRLGALSAEIKDSSLIMKSLDQYAKYIGLAFQIHDDIIDATKNNLVLDKNLNADQFFDKVTYASLLGSKQAKYKAMNLIDNACQALKFIKNKSIDTSTLELLAKYIIQRNE